MPAANTARLPTRIVAFIHSSAANAGTSSWRSRRAGTNADHCEPVEQVAAKAPGLHFGFEGAVRGRHEPDVEFAAVRFANAADVAILDDAEQFGLRARRELAYFVEEEHAAIRLFEEAAPFGNGAGKCALRMDEELGLEQVVRQCGAVHRAERARSSNAGAVDGSRNEFLAAFPLSLPR